MVDAGELVPNSLLRWNLLKCTAETGSLTQETQPNSLKQCHSVTLPKVFKGLLYSVPSHTHYSPLCPSSLPGPLCAAHFSLHLPLNKSRSKTKRAPPLPAQLSHCQEGRRGWAGGEGLFLVGRGGPACHCHLVLSQEVAWKVHSHWDGQRARSSVSPTSPATPPLSASI